jgi:N-acetylglucosamine-6-sulfatase
MGIGQRRHDYLIVADSELTLGEFEQRAKLRRERAAKRARQVRGRRRAAGGILATILVAGIAVGVASGGNELPDRFTRSPSILVITTDDQTLASFARDVMPFTWSFFADEGTIFEQALAVPPLCCPSRAGFLTGQYAHNHGVRSNIPGYLSLRDKPITLPGALRRAGYRTGLVGEFLNFYEAAGGMRPAPGFDRWFSTFQQSTYFNFVVSDDGSRRAFRGPDNYSTDVYTRAALNFVEDSTDAGRPFFLWFAPNAPHNVDSTQRWCPGASAEVRSESDLEPFTEDVAPRTAAFDEERLDDKPHWAFKPPMSQDEVQQMDSAWRCQLGALWAVDQGIAAIVDALDESGALDSTIIVFVSDNGFFYGEHRRTNDKRIPLEPALRVPMAIRLPPAMDADRGASVDQLVSNVDLAPTLLDYAGTRELCVTNHECRTMDGRSLRPLLEGDSESWPDDRGIPIELDDSFGYEALRTPSALYVELTAAHGAPLNYRSHEVYDLVEDPDELQNVAHSRDPDDLRLRRSMVRRLRSLSACAGIQGRDDRTGSRAFCE